MNSISLKLADIQCMGYGRYNPFVLKQTCGDEIKYYVTRGDGRHQLADEWGVPVENTDGSPVILNLDCSTSGQFVECPATYCNGNGQVNGFWPGCQWYISNYFSNRHTCVLTFDFLKAKKKRS